MTRLQALRIHAFQDAAIVLAGLFSLCLTGLGAILFQVAGAVEILGLLAVLLVVCATISALGTDIYFKRIPNGLNLMILAGAVLWIVAAVSGYGPARSIPSGFMMDIMGSLYGTDVSGSVLPALGTAYPSRILLDLACAILVFIPTYFSFSLGLGFGGGDVKMMAPLALFLGWPLGMDFFFLTFLVGAFFSVWVIAIRKGSQLALHLGKDTPAIRRMSKMREFPFAPAIAIAAVVSIAAKLEGVF